MPDVSESRLDLTRRTTISAALENVRIQLLRVSAGIATPEDLRDEVAALARFAEGRRALPALDWDPSTTPCPQRPLPELVEQQLRAASSYIDTESEEHERWRESVLASPRWQMVRVGTQRCCASVLLAPERRA